MVHDTVIEEAFDDGASVGVDSVLGAATTTASVEVAADRPVSDSQPALPVPDAVPLVPMAADGALVVGGVAGPLTLEQHNAIQESQGADTDELMPDAVPTDEAMPDAQPVEGTVSPPVKEKLREIKEGVCEQVPTVDLPPTLTWLSGKTTAYPAGNLTLDQHRKKKVMLTRGQCRNACRGCPFLPDMTCGRICTLPASHLAQGRCDCMCDVHNPRLAAQTVTARFSDSMVSVEQELKNLAMRIELDTSALANRSMIVAMGTIRESSYEALRRCGKVIVAEAQSVFADLHLRVQVTKEKEEGSSTVKHVKTVSGTCAPFL